MAARPANLGLALLLFLYTVPAAGQQLAAGTADLGDWRIEDIRRIRFGRVSLVYDPAGARLDIYTLRDSIPGPSEGSNTSILPEFEGDVLEVADFRTSVRNRLGGFANVFQRAPSSGSAESGIGADGRPGLRIACRNEAGGFCGGWVHFFDFSASPGERRYLDATTLADLTFWVRGENGGEDVLLKIADAAWEKRQDALPMGGVASFLPAGRIETEWQLARVPLSRIPPRVDAASLAVLVFETRTAGDSGFWITGISFSRSRESAMPLPGPEDPQAPARPLQRATWVWHTQELVAEPASQGELIEFLRSERFNVVFLQLPDSSGGDRLPGEILPDGKGLRPLLAALRQAGMTVYALDGYKKYALPEYHEGVLRTIDHVARYNAVVPPEQRFAGFRHDIEPYIMPGFDGPRRDAILRDFLTIVEKSAARARAAGLRYGVDIPFWYDSPDQDSGEPVLIRHRGTLRPASEHIIDLVDDLAIMDYRTSAWGADGTIRHAEGELAYAAKTGKLLYVGLETVSLLDEELIQFAGTPVVDPASLDGPGGAILIAPSPADSTRIVFVPQEILLAGDGTLTDRIHEAGVDPERALWWPVRERTPVPSERLSFARRGFPELQRVMDETTRGFAHSPAFAGFAIHEARTYRRLIGR